MRFLQKHSSLFHGSDFLSSYYIWRSRWDVVRCLPDDWRCLRQRILRKELSLLPDHRGRLQYWSVCPIPVLWQLRPAQWTGALCFCSLRNSLHLLASLYDVCRENVPDKWVKKNGLKSLLFHPAVLRFCIRSEWRSYTGRPGACIHRRPIPLYRIMPRWQLLRKRALYACSTCVVLFAEAVFLAMRNFFLPKSVLWANGWRRWAFPVFFLLLLLYISLFSIWVSAR